MTVMLDSGGVPAAARRDHARDLMQHSFGLDFRVWGEWDDNHWARGTIRGLGPIQAMSATAGPARISVERSPAFIRRVPSDTYKIELLVSGNLVLAQDEREVVLRPGDVGICDLTRPMCLGFPGARPTSVLALLVPRALVPLPPEQLAELTAVRLSGQHGTSALLSAVLQRMALNLDEYDGADGVRISAAVVDLLVAALSNPLDQAKRLLLTGVEGHCSTGCMRTSRRTSTTRAWRRLPSRPRTTSRSAISTSSSRPRSRRWLDGSGTAAWSGAAGSSPIQPCGGRR